MNEIMGTELLPIYADEWKVDIILGIKDMFERQGIERERSIEQTLKMERRNIYNSLVFKWRIFS